MTRPEFQVKPKEFFGFFCITEPDTGHVSLLAHKLGQAFSASARSRPYGPGVKSIATTLILTDPEGLGRMHKVKRPRYVAGVRTIKAHGVTVSTEDALEFALRPSFVDVRDARTELQIAAAILPTIVQVRPALQKLKISDFDIDRFLSDLENFLDRAAKQGTYAH